jgi:AraC family transcriptional regulator
MNLHLKNKLSMTEIAARVSMSYVHFNRRFTAYTGISPVQYLISARVKKSKELLLNTDLSISDIAEACGFDNHYYFSNTFKNGEGISPSSFRKLIRQ